MPMFCSWGLNPRPSGGVKAKSFERVGGEDHHRDEESHHTQGGGRHVRHHRAVARRGEPLRQAGEEGEHHRPEEQRTLLTRPQRRDDEIGRQIAGGISRHVLDVEVVADQTLPETNRRDHHQPEHGIHRADHRLGQGGPALPAAREANDRSPCPNQDRDPEAELTEQCHAGDLAASAAFLKSVIERA